MIKGHSRPRLEGVIGGLYSNPNDLAFAVVLTMPFCLAFLLTSKSAMAKLVWVGGMLIMALTVFPDSLARRVHYSGDLRGGVFVALWRAREAARP